MTLERNPFYVLRIPCTADRRRIAAAAEERGFELSTDVCAAAQNELTNLTKRLVAELDWFIGSDGNIVGRITRCIENKVPISTDPLSGVSRFNASLYNLLIDEKADQSDLGYGLLDLNEQFSGLDLDEISEIINVLRRTAGITGVTVQDVTNALGKKREAVRQAITNRLSSMEEDSYIELVTLLAEKSCSDDDNVVISDIIDQYEIRMQAQIEKSTAQIVDHITRIKGLTNDEAISDHVKDLIAQIENWDKLVQPIQLRSMANGMPHEISEDLGHDIRDLSLYLHNEKKQTQAALTLVKAMQGIFAELGGLAEQFSSDSKVLERLSTEDAVISQVLEEMAKLKKMSTKWRITTKGGVTSFISQVSDLDDRIFTLDIEDELRDKLRTNLYYLAREAAINLHNNKQKSSLALVISKALKNQFGGIASIQFDLEYDHYILDDQVKQKKLLRGLKRDKLLVAIAPVVLVILLLVLTILFGDSC